MKSLKLIIFAATLAASVWAQTNLGSPPPVVVEACIDEDKPPCLSVTRYLPEPDGSNATKIVLAYVVTEQKTNSQGAAYFDSGLMPGEFKETLPGYAGLPVGQEIVLRRGAVPPGSAQLVSVQRLKPTVFVPRSLRPGPPNITVTSPQETSTSAPMIDLKGISDQPLRSVSFDVINAVHQTEDQQGYVIDSYFDTILWRETTNYWECLDIGLAPGTNTIILRFQNFAGRVVVTNLTRVLRFDQDKTPPLVLIEWPTPGRQVSGNRFSIRGQVDEMTAHISGRISAYGRTNLMEGIVERTGRFWVDNLPLLGKTNLLTLTATDAAGNTSFTNLVVIRSETVLTINPVPPSQLWQLQVKVTGKVSPADQDVWVNDRKAYVDSNGVWTATGIPLTQGGVAIFKASAIPKQSAIPPTIAPVGELSAVVTPNESVSIQTGFSAKSVILNATRPTYGAFHLHLTGAEGSSFVLCASTNLVDWSPILTNLNSAATFDYSDTNVTIYGCRFFRVIPIQ